MQQVQDTAGAGAVGIILSVTLNNIEWFDVSTIHEAAGVFTQVVIAISTIYYMYRRYKQKDE